MGRRSTDANVTVTLDRDEISNLASFARGRGLTTAALFRVAMNDYLARHNAQVSSLEIRAKQGRPRKRRAEA